MLKRFIRDCVYRETAVYSPWLIKSAIAARYDISTEMPDQVRDNIQAFKDKQMDKRKRDREERLGITHEEEKVEVSDRPKTKKQKKEEERQAREEEKAKLEAEVKKKPMKYPAEGASESGWPSRNSQFADHVPPADLMVEYSHEKDEPAGRIEVRPAPNRDMPFGDRFEKLLMSWSFLNVMGWV